MKPEFNSDGSIKVPGKVNVRLSPERKVFKLLRELNYSPGKRLLAEVLKGEYSDKVKKLKLNQLPSYGSLELYDFPDIYRLLDQMISRGIIKIEKSRRTRFLPVIVEGDNSPEETQNPQLSGEDFEEVTEEDKRIFSAFGNFLDGFNDEQKKCIVDNSKRLLCVAGAGSGKTTVLTKKAEFFAKFMSVPPERILAITFTRKARQEMISRLAPIMPGINIETFNSFCEKLLKNNESLIYDKPYGVINFSDKITLVKEALTEMEVSVNEALQKYYTKKKLAENENRKLFIDLVGDVFSIIENCKNNDSNISEAREAINNLEKQSDKNTALFVYSIIKRVEKYKQDKGLRDYTDQLVDGLRLIKKHPELVQNYQYVLVDEFQDVNELQVKLLSQMNPEHLFAVGDPRQSIYGWRGSRVNYIMNFKNLYPDARVIQLSKNYRSCRPVVNTGNVIIKNMNLPPLEAVKEKDEDITLLQNPDEETESLFIARSILSQDIPGKNIFVLVRTNRQAEYLADVLTNHNIAVLKRTVEEQKQKLEPAENEVTISTVHAIKGLEAELVYIAGVNSNHFPCLVSDKPVLDKMKLNDNYDKYMEELRLLYVAMTRASQKLVVSYYNNLSPFVTTEVMNMLKVINNGTKSMSKEEKLRQWRMDKARELGLKPYMVFPDKALYQLIAMKPASYEQLSDIQGISENKVERFGDELLDFINTQV